MLAAFLRLPDGAHAPAPVPPLTVHAALHTIVKVERRNVQMRWLPQDPKAPPHLLVHVPLHGTIHHRTTDGTLHVCRPGQMLLDRRPHAGAHQNRPQEGRFRNCWAMLTGSAILAAADAAILAHGVCIDLESRPAIWAQVQAWFAAALQEHHLDAATLGGMAFTWLARVTAGRSPSGVAAALELIERTYHDPDLSVARLARAAGCASSTFSRRFHAAVGVAPYRYLRDWRLGRARERLVSGEPIHRIAVRCGFRDSAHFVHSFRAVVGISPHRYRRSLQP